MAYPIERGVPIPPPDDPAEIEFAVMRELEFGDSFLVPNVRTDLAAFREFSIRTVALHWGVRIEIRAVDGGLRVWRVA